MGGRKEKCVASEPQVADPCSRGPTAKSGFQKDSLKSTTVAILIQHLKKLPVLLCLHKRPSSLPSGVEDAADPKTTDCALLLMDISVGFTQRTNSQQVFWLFLKARPFALTSEKKLLGQIMLKCFLTTAKHFCLPIHPIVFTRFMLMAFTQVLIAISNMFMKSIHGHQVSLVSKSSK